jgi:hypothetical protein
MSLSDEQKRHAVRLAQQKGLSCSDCGSSEPVPEDEVQVHPGGRAESARRCEDCESASEMTPVLSPGEAKALGFGHALRERSEEAP